MKRFLFGVAVGMILVLFFEDEVFPVIETAPMPQPVMVPRAQDSTKAPAYIDTTSHRTTI